MNPQTLNPKPESLQNPKLSTQGRLQKPLWEPIKEPLNLALSPASCAPKPSCTLHAPLPCQARSRFPWPLRLSLARVSPESLKGLESNGFGEYPVTRFGRSPKRVKALSIP